MGPFRILCPFPSFVERDDCPTKSQEPFVEALGEGWKCAHLVKAREEGTVIKSSILAGR